MTAWLRACGAWRARAETEAKWSDRKEQLSAIGKQEQKWEWRSQAISDAG